MSTSKTFVFRSSDNGTFKVEEAVALESQIIKHMIEDNCVNSIIHLPKVTSNILSKIIEYCKKHVKTPKSEERNSGNAFKTFDADFIKVDHYTLFNLILATKYLKF
ncbi:SKP1-like protein 1A [Cornus florida]|uniref:SKP1-like protein 1A n=1 Tax=Cornus florida TaxID=4283 RepID=UPI00289A3B30|nr:SKP1-like protein 1A [Cornus florida]